MISEPYSRKSVTFSDAIWERIITVQHALRIASQSEALRQVVEVGLESLESRLPTS